MCELNLKFFSATINSSFKINTKGNLLDLKYSRLRYVKETV